jgi:hypothetical protein
LTVTVKPTGPPEADAAVIEQSWAEPERFAAIFERYFSQIYQYLAGRVGPKIADDLAAEAFGPGVVRQALRRRAGEAVRAGVALFRPAGHADGAAGPPGQRIHQWLGAVPRWQQARDVAHRRALSAKPSAIRFSLDYTRTSKVFPLSTATSTVWPWHSAPVTGSRVPGAGCRQAGRACSTPTSLGAARHSR